MNKDKTQMPTDWQFAQELDKLENNGVLMARVFGKQIALFDTENGVVACDNRCPHEGYPLSEGNLSTDCVLTCNWHNWKFDLETGENLLGGDRLRTYPVQLRGPEIWVNIADPPFAERYQAIIDSLMEAFNDHSYDRISREIARLVRLGGDPLDVLRNAIEWSWQKMEFGWTHAYAGMADWLTIYIEHADDTEIKLVCLQEGVAHTAYDVQREREYPFTDKISDYDENKFLQAIETENEDDAIAMIRGALREGLQFSDLECALTRAALNHYNDFGHSLIYVTKADELIRHLGDRIVEPILLSLVRSIIFATREDRIPEFRKYQDSLDNWGNAKGSVPAAKNWHYKGINSALDLTLECSDASPSEIYTQLLLANAHNLLHYDIQQQEKTHIPISGNVGWLDYTHGLTFGNAVRKQCTRFPVLWPQGLLQMACFSGRNAAYVAAEVDTEYANVSEDVQDIENIINKVLDHGQGEYIVSVHWLKTALAVREEIHQLPEPKGKLLVEALNRFFEAKLKRRHTRRTAYQSLQFVAKE